MRVETRIYVSFGFGSFIGKNSYDLGQEGSGIGQVETEFDPFPS
jgi:hypothetical protein